MQARNIGRVAALDALHQQIEHCAASAENLKRILDSLGPRSDLKAALPAKIRFDKDDLVLSAILHALMDCN